MKTVVCVKPGQLESIQRERPEPKSGEVLVKIKAVGICGTDIHAYGGNQPFFQYPRVLGHELSGVIEKTGDNTSIDVGVPVYIIPYLHCGKCIACRQGKTNCCTDIEVIGVHRDGGMQEYLCVPESAVVITEGVSFNDMAVIECLAIGAHSVRRAEITKEDTVLVLGAGPIGMGALQFAQVAGAKVFIADVKQEKLDFCEKEFNVDATVDVTKDMTSQLSELTNGEFPTVIIDCTGNSKAMESAFYNLAHGGKIVFVSVIKSPITFEDPEFHKRETTLLGSRNATLQDFEQVVACLKTGQVKTTNFVTHTSKFDDFIENFSTWVKPETGVIKAVIEMD